MLKNINVAWTTTISNIYVIYVNYEINRKEFFMIKFIIFVIIYCFTDFIFFYLTNKHYCKKYKGDCTKCKDWSCYRQKYLDKKGYLKK